MDVLRRRPQLLDCLAGSKALGQFVDLAVVGVCSVALVCELIPTSVGVPQRKRAPNIHSAPKALAHPLAATRVSSSVYCTPVASFSNGNLHPKHNLPAVSVTSIDSLRYRWPNLPVPILPSDSSTLCTLYPHHHYQYQQRNFTTSAAPFSSSILKQAPVTCQFFCG